MYAILHRTYLVGGWGGVMKDNYDAGVFVGFIRLFKEPDCWVLVR